MFLELVVTVGQRGGKSRGQGKANGGPPIQIRWVKHALSQVLLRCGHGHLHCSHGDKTHPKCHLPSFGPGHFGLGSFKVHGFQHQTRAQSSSHTDWHLQVHGQLGKVRLQHKQRPKVPN
ncbi:hypothetical protein BASA81_000190 [Batrachochytrium salamandrivorans]|nr:hypothetical protein BASA81_000190 [Batrachochytrium salamandrivorans]